MHVHASLKLTADLYGTPVAGLKESDVCLFGGEIVFRLRPRQCHDVSAVGRRDHGAQCRSGRRRMASLRCCASIRSRYFSRCRLSTLRFLQARTRRRKVEVKIRRCISAGEALPEEIARNWKERYGVEVSDGLGTTEMLHIYLTNRSGRDQIRHHRQAGAGLRDQADRRRRQPVKKGEMGELYVRGPDQRDHVLEQPREIALDLSGRVDPFRRQIYRGCRRLLRLLRARRTTC